MSIESKLGVIDSTPVLEHAQRINEWAHEAAEKNSDLDVNRWTTPILRINAAKLPDSPRRSRTFNTISSSTPKAVRDLDNGVSDGAQIVSTRAFPSRIQ
jgi:hypothetical protein